MSGQRFGQAALRLCAIAARLLGWRPAEFWSATPAELAAILAPEQEHQGLGRGELVSMMEKDHD